MRVNLVRIGNSTGIRIPKAILEQCEFGSEAELLVDEGKLIVAPVKSPRADWEEAFRVNSAQDDSLLLKGVRANDFDQKEWEW